MTDPDAAEPQVADEPRRYPSTIGGLGYMLVLAIAAAALLVTIVADWRMGVRVLSADLVLAATMRAVLSEADAGMLAVRNRWLDVAGLVLVAGALFFLAGSIPDQPG